jgi:hypothetical protein
MVSRRLRCKDPYDSVITFSVEYGIVRVGPAR